MSKKDFAAAMESGPASFDNPYTNMGKAATTKRRYTKKAPATAAEANQRAEEMRTQGREGCKLPRISVGFRPSVYDYVRVMSAMTGKNMTEFVNDVMTEHMESHAELYEQAVKLRESL